MGTRMKVFLDSCIVIYLVEGSEGFSELIGTAMRTAKPSVYSGQRPGPARVSRRLNPDRQSRSG